MLEQNLSLFLLSEYMYDVCLSVNQFCNDDSTKEKCLQW